MSALTSEKTWRLRAIAASTVFWVATLLTVVVGTILRGDPVAAADSDVSWLIDMCERIVNGERAYVDIFETTPPVPMLLYMPGVLIGRLTGLTPEAVTFAFAYLSVLVSLWLSARILPERIAEGGESKWLFLAPATIVLLVLPRDVFAQREYFAAAFSLPIVAVFIHHAQENIWPAFKDRAAAAALAGLALAIKAPLFALPGIFLAVYYWYRIRSISFLLPSGLLAAGIVSVVLTAASLAVFPDYLGGVSAVLRDVYVPTRMPFFAFLSDKGCLGVLSCVGLTLLLSSTQKSSVASLLACAAAVGFFFSYLVQSKYFYYHVFPAAPLAASAAVIPACARIRKNLRPPPSPWITIFVYGLAALGISFLFFVSFRGNGSPPISDLSWARGLHNPRTLAISPDAAISFPLARRIEAVWVDRIHSQWIAHYTRFALQYDSPTGAERVKLLNYHNGELVRILRQIKEKSPEIIIQDVWPRHLWLTSELNTLEPGFLDKYRTIYEEGPVRILRLSVAHDMSGLGSTRSVR